jgi:anti-sigma-K factor RskA
VNIQHYISSGILEAYVAGELSAAETVALEKNLVLYPELKRELALVEKTQELLLMKAAVRPQPRVKQELFRKLGKNHPKVKNLNRDHTYHYWRFAAAASVVVAIVMGYLAFDYRNRWKASESELVALTQQNQRVAENYNQVNERLNKLQADVDVMTDPQFKRISMTGTKNAPEALASIYWKESTKEVYLRIRHMKALSQENQYQLWAIIDGKPVDAGVFDADVAGLLKMKNVPEGASIFAVTIERRGGNPVPSLETIQLSGNVQKG